MSEITYPMARAWCRERQLPQNKQNLAQAFRALGHREKVRRRERAVRRQDEEAIRREIAKQEAMGLR